MAIYVKRGDGQWDEAENTAANLKIRDSSGWKDIYLVYVKTPTGWQIVWDNAAPPPVISSSSTAAYSTETSSITIEWTQPTIYNFDRYEFTTDNGATWGDASTNANLRSKTWNGLTERTSYTVGVRVVNKSGRTGEAKTTITTANSNPQPPTGGSVTDVTSSSGKLNWTASTSTDKKGGGYTYAINNSNDTVTVGWTDSTSFDITGLAQNSSYTYKVYTRDTGDLYSSALSLTISTSNAAPPAATVTAWSTGDTGVDYSSPGSVLKTGTWRVQYSGEAVSAIAYLFDSANNWTGRSSTLYDSNNRQTSIDTYVTFGDLAYSTEYRVAVDVTDANSATTRSSYIGNTTPSYRLYRRDSGIAWATGSMNATGGLSASTAVGGFEASKAASGSSGWWLSQTNSASTSSTAYEYIQWDPSWPGGTVSSLYTEDYNYDTGVATDGQTANPARQITGYEYAAADTDQGASGNGSTTTGNFDVYFSVYNGSGWSGSSTIPYGGSNGYNINYVDLSSQIGNDGYISKTLGTNRTSEPLKVRYTLTRLQQHTGYTGFRASAFYVGISYRYAYAVNIYYYR